MRIFLLQKLQSKSSSLCGRRYPSSRQFFQQTFNKGKRGEAYTFRYPFGTLGSLKIKSRKLESCVLSSTRSSAAWPKPLPALLAMPARQSAKMLASASRAFRILSYPEQFVFFVKILSKETASNGLSKMRAAVGSSSRRASTARRGSIVSRRLLAIA